MRCPVCAPAGVLQTPRHSVVLDRSFIDGVILNYVQTPQGEIPQYKPGQRFWDEDDREHAHQTQRTVHVYTCSHGHHWRVFGAISKCPVDGCTHHVSIRLVLDEALEARRQEAIAAGHQLINWDRTIFLDY